MSSPNSSSKPDRKALLQAVTMAVYESSTMAVFFHSAIAEQAGLGATEEKTLLMLSGGPLTAGEIARHTGLTTASVTNLIDRLESKGFVQRVRDTSDRRRIFIELNQARFAELARVIGSLQGTFDDLLDQYSDEQLATILDYVTRAVQRSREALVKLNVEKKSK